MNVNLNKKCPRCQKVKPLSDYYDNRSSPIGKSYWCKSCDREVSRIRGRINDKKPERIAKTKAWLRSEKGKDSRKRYYIENKLKIRIRSLVVRLVRANKIIKLPCSVCGDVRSMAHHPDYSKPLDVMWLCHKHHSEVHRIPSESPSKLGGRNLKRYVAGFLFDDRGYVALINKRRPEWQRGKLNGIGGHIEKDESSENAMVREFKEETGLAVFHWKHFATVGGSSYSVEWFMTRLSWQTELGYRRDIASITDEAVGWYLVDKLPSNIIPNLKWLIPLADYKEDVFASVSHESETC